MIPPDGSAITLVGGVIGMTTLDVMRPPESDPRVRVYSSTHLVMRPGSQVPDRSTQGEWPLVVGVADRIGPFNGTLMVYAPDGYDVHQSGEQRVCHRKQGISQSYGPPPVEP